MNQKFIKICISLSALLGRSHVTKDEDKFNIDLKNCLQEKYPETNLEELRSEIDKVEIKKLLSAQMATRFLDFS